MNIRINPYWTHKDGAYLLIDDDKNICATINETTVSSYVVNLPGKSEDRKFDNLFDAKCYGELGSGFEFFLERETVMSKGCRCGSCTDETGNWLVFNRADTVNEVFESREKALEWICDHYES